MELDFCENFGGRWVGGKIQFTAKIYPISCSKRDLIKSPALDFTQPDIELEQAAEIIRKRTNFGFEKPEIKNPPLEIYFRSWDPPGKFQTLFFNNWTSGMQL